MVYFNSVGGIRFPYTADAAGTIAAKRGRIVMFENYEESSVFQHVRHTRGDEKLLASCCKHACMLICVVHL